MIYDIDYVIDQLLNNKSFTYTSLESILEKSLELIVELKEQIVKDEKSENHELFLSYISIQSDVNRREIFDEICKIYRKPFLTHKLSLSRTVIASEEIYLHIVKNDKRFFNNGPEQTSVDVIEEKLGLYLGTLYSNCFSKNNQLRKKEIYDALVTLEETTDPPLITTTKLRPGTGSGKRRRKRYCLTENGFNEIIPIISIVVRDQLENLRVQI